MANNYEELHCCKGNCNNKEGIWFGADEGDEPVSRIICSECLVPNLMYIIERGYNDFDPGYWFKKPYCNMCEQGEIDLFIPKNENKVKPSMVLCKECIDINE